MATNSFKVKNSLVLTPRNLSTITNPEAGDLACDINDNNKLKRYDTVTSSWVELGSSEGAAVSTTINTFNGDNSTTTFTLSIDPLSKDNTQVYVDGVYQNKATYSVTGTSLQFSEAPPTGTGNIEVEMLSLSAIGSLPDATSSVKGVLKLAGDLGGTADLPTVPALSAKANLSSPALTGIPTAPTASLGTNTTQIATTEFVNNQIAASSAIPSSVSIKTASYTIPIGKYAKVESFFNGTGLSISTSAPFVSPLGYYCTLPTRSATINGVVVARGVCGFDISLAASNLLYIGAPSTGLFQLYSVKPTSFTQDLVRVDGSTITAASLTDNILYEIVAKEIGLLSNTSTNIRSVRGTWTPDISKVSITVPSGTVLSGSGSGWSWKVEEYNI